MTDYASVFRGLPQPVQGAAAFAHLDNVLPPVWLDGYAAQGGEILEVTLGGSAGDNGAFTYMFDLQPTNSKTDSRVVAVWGMSGSEPASTRDSGRIAGLLKGFWSKKFPGRDRGHFMAHTMGGEMDINLFPQLSWVNRGGIWREMEKYAVVHPGTFSFVRPIYRGSNWTPDRLEYGLFKLPPASAPGLWVTSFGN